jgi:poly(A) polymerase
VSQPALYDAMDEVLDRQAEKLAITKRIVGDIKEIWALQPRFEKRAGKAPYRMLEQPRLRAAYDFLLLRAESGEAPQELAEWWTEFQDANPDQRAELLLPDSGGPKKRRRSRSRGRKAADDGASAAD